VEYYTCYWRYWRILSELFAHLTSNNDTNNLCIGYGWDVYNVSNSELESDFEFYFQDIWTGRISGDHVVIDNSREMSEKLVMEYITLIEEQESIREEETHDS